MVKLQRKDVESALNEIGATDKVPPEHRQKKYCLDERGEHWPPKYIVAVAWKHATGTQKDHRSFSGGKFSNNQLTRLGYSVLACEIKHYQ
jgi:hypothetical protein